jgi:hypothetical protein
VPTGEHCIDALSSRSAVHIGLWTVPDRSSDLRQDVGRGARPGRPHTPTLGGSVTQAPLDSPRASRLATPGWLDARLVLGVLLVLVSVVVGARVLSAADRSQLVWSTARDLAPGTELTADDVVATRVRLFGNAERYLSAEQPPPVGYLLERALGAEELLPREALSAPGGTPDFRAVTLNVRAGNAPPDLRGGEQVDVYLTPQRPETAAAAPDPAAVPDRPVAAGGSRLVLASVTVLQVPAADGFGAGSEQRAVVLRVPPDDVAAVLSATELGRIDLVRVPSGLPGAAASADTAAGAD